MGIWPILKGIWKHVCLIWKHMMTMIFFGYRNKLKCFWKYPEPIDIHKGISSISEKKEVKEAISSSTTQYKENIGHIESPNFPNGYALNGETFTYMLQNLDPYGHIRLIFDDWDIAKESWIQVTVVVLC